MHAISITQYTDTAKGVRNYLMVRPTKAMLFADYHAFKDVFREHHWGYWTASGQEESSPDAWKHILAPGSDCFDKIDVSFFPRYVI
ncbi:MAG: hypothetical protein GY943_34750 [Chloroflexi bacterium]|nr:hypothetical protein [Chloroflexota bacterium]